MPNGIIIAQNDDGVMTAYQRIGSADGGADGVPLRERCRQSARYMHSHRLSRAQLQRLNPHQIEVITIILIDEFRTALDLGFGFAAPNPLPPITGVPNDEDVCEYLSDMLIDISLVKGEDNTRQYEARGEEDAM